MTKPAVRLRNPFNFAVYTGLWLLLVLMRLALRLLGYRRCLSLLHRLSPGTAALSSEPAPRARELALRIEQAGSHWLWKRIYCPRCFERSLLLWWILRLQHIESEIRFGARREGEKITAHAWVEQNGEVLNDTTDVSSRYQPIVYPSLIRDVH